MWNYRIMRRVYTGPDNVTEITDGIHEVYYTGDEQKISGWTESPVGILSDPGEMAAEFERLQSALQKPILCYTTGEPINVSD